MQLEINNDYSTINVDSRPLKKLKEGYLKINQPL